MWKSAGIVIRGVITQALQKTPGPFAGGEKPGEPDCEACPFSAIRRRFMLNRKADSLVHIITWLARMATDAGVAPGSKANEVMPKLEKIMGGHSFDPVVSKYWE
jgi:hypothetical protein